MKNRNESGLEPTLESIVDLVDGRLDDQAVAAIEQGLTLHPEAKTAFEWVHRFRSTTQRIIIEDPPTSLRQGLLDLGGLLRDPAEGVLERIIAVLKFDSWAQSLAVPAVRHVGSTRQQRHMLFAAGGVDVAIDLFWEANAVDVLGVVLSERGGERSIDTVLVSDQPLDVPVEVSADGEFGFRIESTNGDATLDRDEFSTLEVVVRVGTTRIHIGPLSDDP